MYKQTLKTDGIVGLYRGFNISFVGIFVYRGFYFGLYDTIMPIIGSDSNPMIKFAVGYAVTVVAGLLSYAPPELIVSTALTLNLHVAAARTHTHTHTHSHTHNLY